MSGCEEDGCESYDISPVLRSPNNTILPTPPSTYLLEDATSPALMPKRGSTFSKSLALLDKHTPNVTPVPAPRRLSSNRKQSDGSVEVNSQFETRPDLTTHFSKSLDLTETHGLPEEVFNLRLTGQSDSNIYNLSFTEQPLSKSFHPPSDTSSDELTNTKFENSCTTNIDLLNQTSTPVPVVRPVPKPRSRTRLPVTQSLDVSMGLSLQSVKNELPVRQSEQMNYYHSKSPTKADERQEGNSYFSERDPTAVEFIQSDEVNKKFKSISVKNKIDHSGFSELMSDINHRDSINGSTHNALDDSIESNHYVSPDIIRNGLFVFQNLEPAPLSPPIPKAHSNNNSPSYVKMTDKRQTQTSVNTPSVSPTSVHKYPVVYNSEQNINLDTDIFIESTTDSTTAPQDSSKGFDLNPTFNNTIQKPFNDIQPFKSKVILTSHTFDKEELSTKMHKNVNTSKTDFTWSGISKPVQSPSKNSFGKPVEPSLSSPDSDFPVDWDSAFARPATSNVSSFFSSRPYVSTGMTNGTSETPFSPGKQKSTTATSPFKPQNHGQPSVHEAPSFLPPPLPHLKNHIPCRTPPPPIPIRPNSTANLNSQTMFQTSPVEKNPTAKIATTKDIFCDLPNPAFLQNESSDPFQDSNFGMECLQYNTNNKEPCPPSKSSLQELSAVKAGVSSSDVVNAKTTFDQNGDMEQFSNITIPSPNSNDFCSSDSESPDIATSNTSYQGLDNDCGTRYTRLKVFDSSLLPKENARCGYLYKQGGYKANKGWKKRWVVYNGTNLSYYSSNTAQVSKRIIPVRCMLNIETDVKATDKTSFRFKVVTSLKDRVFIFSSETLDDCLTWANTLMAAITLYKKSVKLSDQPIEKPDIEGFIKFGNMKKYYVTIMGKTLCYYQSFEDFQMGSPTHEIDMKLASVKVKDHKKLQLWIHYGHFNLTFESDQEMQHWRLAMEDAIAAGLADDTVLMKVYENMSNRNCADCGVENPHWASVNLGIVICKNCAGIHRMFDYRVSKIRSLRMDTRVWTPSLIELMVTIGNANANAFWEFDLPAGAKIQPTESTDKRKEFIFKKYRTKQFCNLHPLANQGPSLGEVLLNAASRDSVLEMIKVLFSGADVLYRKNDHDPTAYDVAKEHGQRLIMELLYQNGGDPQTSEQDVTDENRLREDVRLQGYLNKTGPVGRSFEKRWCILEHGTLTYYLNEKSKTFKGSIHRKDMYFIQAAENDRIGYPFEISTGLKDNRVFTFSSDSRDNCGEWIRTIGKLMAPVAVMNQVGMIDVKFAGYALMKESLVDEWHQTFLVFSWRGLYYMNRDQKFDHLDLRKASGIKMQDSSNSYQQRGPCFVISSTGKSVYLQAMLTRDTEKMYTALLEAVVSSGSTLIDQALTNENVPVIVEKCITHIYMNALQEEGIYRTAGQNSRIQALLDEFRRDVWSVSLNAYTIQDVSNALKRFLRELDDSVFGRVKYASWINKAGCKEVNNRLMWYKYYLEKMPQVNFQTLKRIILHLVEVSQYESVNKMSISNLASCFAPSLLRTAKDDPILASDAAGKEISIIVDLLNNPDYFFNVNDDERIILNNIKWAEKEIQKRIQENRVSLVDPATTGMLIPVHLLCREGQSVNILVTEEKLAKEAMEYLKRNKTVPELGIYVLYEQLFRGALERPIFPEDIISKTTNRWMEWESWVMEDNNVCLCVQGLELLEKLNTHLSPNQALLSKHQYCDFKPKSKFKRRVIGFRQCKLALYSDSQGNSEMMSWKVEDITIYLGSVPRRTLPPYRYCLTFVVNGEKYTKPSFGHCISFETEHELCRWTAALYAAQHPTGLLSWATE